MGPDLFACIIAALFSLAALFIIFSTICLIRGGVLYLGSPRAVVAAMLSIADIRPGEKVYDLGCGDGRLLFPAVRSFGAQATGVDISGLLLALAWLQSRLLKAPVRLIRQNLLSVDFSEADVVFLYLMPEILLTLQERFRQLKPGSRIISHQFGLAGWAPEIEMPVHCWCEDTLIFRYRVTAPGPALPVSAATAASPGHALRPSAAAAGLR